MMHRGSLDLSRRWLQTHLAKLLGSEQCLRGMSRLNRLSLYQALISSSLCENEENLDYVLFQHSWVLNVGSVSLLLGLSI